MSSNNFRNNNDSKFAAAEFLVWAKNRLHRVAVPNPNLRKRLSGASFVTSIDLCGAIQILCLNGSKTGAFVLLRSALENYYRGLWFAYVADEGNMSRFLAGRESNTLKNLIKKVRDAKIASIDPEALAGLENKVSLLDDLAHGGIRAMNSRNLGGYEVGSSEMSENDLLILLSMSCTTIWLCLENITRTSFENEIEANQCREEGSKLFKILLDSFKVDEG